MKEKTQRHDKTNWHRTKEDEEYLYRRAEDAGDTHTREVIWAKVKSKHTHTTGKRTTAAKQSGRRDLS